VLLLSNRIRCAGLLGVFGLLVSSSFAGGPHGAAKVKHLSLPSAQKKLDQASARFVQNVGQWPKKAIFLARSQNLNVWLTDTGVTYDYFDLKLKGKKPGRKGHVVSMSFKGGSSFAPVGDKKLRFDNLYFKGRGQTEHKAGNFAGAIAQNVYPGVNVHSYYDQGKPRYDLVVKPKADPSAIKLAFHGAYKTAISGNSITLSTQVGVLSHGKLFAYQNIGGKKQQVSANFVALGKDVYGFKLGAYDRSKELVIDPLVYGSYYGGDSGFDSVNSITTDNAGGVYLTGYTMAPDFPAIDGPYGFSLHGDGTTKDAFVAKLQGDAFDQFYSAYVGGSLDDNAQFIKVDPFGDIWIAGRTTSSDFPTSTRDNVQFLTTDNVPATGGYFVIQYGSSGPKTAHIPYNATAAQVQTALNAVISGAVVTSLGGSTVAKGDTYQVNLPYNEPYLLNVLLSPFGTSTVQNADYNFLPKTSFIFVMRFKQSATTVLDPNPGSETVQLFGGNDEFLSGFAIQPEANPQPTDPINFAFGGTLDAATPEIPNYPGGGVTCGYVIKYTYSNVAQAFTQDNLITRYVVGGNAINLNGVAMDLQGSVYTGGTILYQGNVDTSTAPGNAVFTTTKGVFANGRLLRNNDLFVQKYTPDGNMAYSALIGGSDNDQAGGLDFDEDGTTYTSGNCIDIDSNLDLYIVGIAGSFNFPRTRGVYGEVFDANSNVTVTKINTDASQILYSTNLKTGGVVLPSGVAVDLRGDAFVTGNVHPNYYDFPDTFTGNPANAANPNEPNSMPLGTIQVTSDALVGTNMQPTGGAGDMATVKGFLNILDPAADQLTYGTYLGGALDDRVFGPYVDSFGDVWVFGWVDVYRQYVLFDSSGNPHIFTDSGSADGWLPAAMISPLAFKSTPYFWPTATLGGILYGALSQTYPNYTPWSWPPTTTAPGYPVATIQVSYGMEGWLDKLRVGLASISGISLSPSTVPGGLGASTTGTVTLSQAAPNGGASVVLTLLNNTTAASFTTGSQTSTLVITIPAGASTGTFTVYTNPVTSNTPVQVQAGYEGSFQIGLFTVTPWLQQLSLTPTSVVGGNAVSGKINLAALPPTGSGGINVTILTDTPSLVSFPGGATVNVPEGQTSVTFTINTNGVGVVSFPQVTASLLGVGITQTLTVTLASLSQLTFNPASVSGGTSSTATLQLDGQATGPFVVNLTASDPAYTFSDPTTLQPINSLTFNQGDTAQQFIVNTPYALASTQVVVTATRPAQGNYPSQSISSTLFVSSQNLTTFTISPTEVPGGGTSTGTVIINAAAPDGGVIVNLSSNNTAAAQVPATVLIPSGATSATFTITTGVLGSQQTATITAQRGPVSIQQVLTVDGVSFGFSLSPTSVVGGPSGIVTGTITLTSPAPAAGLDFTISSDHPNDAFFGSVGNGTGTASIPGNGLTGTFTIFTAVESTQTQEAVITANVVGGSAAQAQSANLEIRVVGVTSIKFAPKSVRGGFGITTCTITLDAPAPSNSAGGSLVTLSQTTPLLNLNAGGYLIPAGSTSISFPVKGIRVSRSLSTIVTATPPNGGGTASAVVVVTR